MTTRSQTFNVATKWKIKNKTKTLISYLVPGPVVMSEYRYAKVSLRQGAQYYSVRLSYWTIDGAPDAERGAFDTCLKEAAYELFGSTPEAGSDPFHQLFLKLAPELPAHARNYGSGLKWASFAGVTKEFVEQFLAIVNQLYGKALALYNERYGDWTNEQWKQFNLGFRKAVSSPTPI
jgi:hypothetical protein